MDFLKKEQERKAKEKKGSASLPMSMLENPVLTWPSDTAEYRYSDGEFAVPMAGPYDDEALKPGLDFIGSGFSPGEISGRSRTAYQAEEARRKALAKKYFKNGISHFKRENYNQAADQFKESYETYNNFRLFYNIGLCYNNAGFKNSVSGDFVKAYGYLVEFLEGMEKESPPHDWEGKEKQKKWAEGAVDFYKYLASNHSAWEVSVDFEEKLLEWQQIQYKKTGGEDEQALDDIKKKELSQQEAGSTVDNTFMQSSTETVDAKFPLDNTIKKSFSENKQEDDQKVKKAKEYFNKAKKYYKDGLYKEAIKEFENSYKELPLPQMLFNIGVAYEKIAEKGENSEENYKNAIDYLEKSIEGFKKEGTSSQKDVKDAETKIANIKAVVKKIVSKKEKAKEAETKKTPPAAKAKTPAKKVGEAEKSKVKPADKKKTPAKQPKKVEKGKGDESSPGFAIIASYRMRRIKHSGKAVINLNQWTQESLIFRFDENIGGLSKYIDNPSFFRAVNLDDPVYKQREVVVILDGQDSEDFSKYINYVTVQIRKEHENGKLTHDELKIDRNNFNSDTNRFMMMYGWKGDNNREDWLEYRYRTQWSFHGGVQKQEDWKTSNDFVITVTPPHKYRRVILETDPSVFKDRGVRDASIKFYSNFYGKEMVKQVTIRTRENVFTKELEYAHPEGNFDYEYEITWHLRGGVVLKSGRLKSSSDVIYCDELPGGDKTLYY
jgi:tetratricopeptide (TPR) repeat protein